MSRGIEKRKEKQKTRTLFEIMPRKNSTQIKIQNLRIMLEAV